MDLYPSKARRLRRALLALLPLMFLTGVCLLFALSVSLTSRDTLQKEQTHLTQALTNGAVHTYALTGRYPETLEELLADSGITYDRSSFVVEYLPSASNLLPHISVLPRTQSTGGRS